MIDFTLDVRNGLNFKKIPPEARYLLLHDRAIRGDSLKNLLLAMNQLAVVGWSCIDYNEYRDMERWGTMGSIKGQALMELGVRKEQTDRYDTYLEDQKNIKKSISQHTRES